MLESLLQHINNWFPREKHTGSFTVQGGKLLLPFLQDGQYYRIMGSIFNDGLHKYGSYTDLLQDEIFDGQIWALAIPKDVQDLAKEMSDWQSKNGSSSPYLSESFGGYSYSRASNSQTGQPATVYDAFRSQLNKWRRIGGI